MPQEVGELRRASWRRGAGAGPGRRGGLKIGEKVVRRLLGEVKDLEEECSLRQWEMKGQKGTRTDRQASAS